MSLNWWNWENPVAIWWAFLSSVSVVNMVTWIWTFLYFRDRSRIESVGNKAVVLFSSLYVFGCAFRSFVPRADVQRITLFDSWIASVLVGRTVATFAELAFVAQWALILRFAGRESGSRLVEKMALTFVPIIVVAEICSWYAVVTTSYIGNSIEESLWALTYALIGISIVRLLPKLRGALKNAARIAVVGCILYVAFMVFVDVPMYLHRWSVDTASGKEYFGLIEGFQDLGTRWIVTHDIRDWRDEIPWMSLYFSFAVWVSLALCFVPMNTLRLRNYLVSKDS